MVLLVAYLVYGAFCGSTTYVILSFSMWFLVASWLFSPFLFNPSGFEWQKIVEDWEDWTKWISSRGGIGVPANKSWESWWEEEQEHLQYSGVCWTDSGNSSFLPLFLLPIWNCVSSPRGQWRHKLHGKSIVSNCLTSFSSSIF